MGLLSYARSIFGKGPKYGDDYVLKLSRQFGDVSFEKTVKDFSTSYDGLLRFWDFYKSQRVVKGARILMTNMSGRFSDEEIKKFMQRRYDQINVDIRTENQLRTFESNDGPASPDSLVYEYWNLQKSLRKTKAGLVMGKIITEIDTQMRYGV